MLYFQNLLKYMCKNEGLHSNLGVVLLEAVGCRTVAPLTVAALLQRPTN
jgi:hypothetical protein